MHVSLPSPRLSNNAIPLAEERNPSEGRGGGKERAARKGWRANRGREAGFTGSDG